MSNTGLTEKVINSTKWASLAELISKLIVPVTNLLLARLLAPDAFGVVAIVIMIVSFAEMFSDAGFQKYLIQHVFKDEVEKRQKINVAFWTNLGISLSLWGVIALFCKPIANLVGSPGLGIVIALSCIQLPLLSFTSIQTALFRRNFQFKQLFWVRLIAAFIPLLISVPLALCGLDYWSIILGTLISQATSAIILTYKSDWKPNRYYSFGTLKEMMSFSIWSLIESISIWLTSWVDALIIGSLLSSYYLGIYRTSTILVNSATGIVTAAIVPVLYSALSRLQEDNEQFNHIFYKVQRIVAMLVLPIGVGMFIYSEQLTLILLGRQWTEASVVIGNWALTSIIMIVYGHFCSEVYRAKGRPKLSFFAQVFHIVFLVPVCFISIEYGFWYLVIARSWSRIQFVLVHFFIMKFSIGMSITRMIKNTLPAVVSSVLLGISAYIILQLYDYIIWQVASIFLCGIIYVGVLCVFPVTRNDLLLLRKRLFR